jgi:hypothetical protein
MAERDVEGAQTSETPKTNQEPQAPKPPEPPHADPEWQGLEVPEPEGENRISTIAD